jgi:hypothetical protein
MNDRFRWSGGQWVELVGAPGSPDVLAGNELAAGAALNLSV